MLAEVDGEPILRRVTRTFRAAGFEDVLVVTRPDGGDGPRDSLRKLIEDLSPAVRCVENPRWRDGMFTSVKAGLAALDVRSTHVAVSPADLPFLGAEALRRVLERAGAVDERTLLVPLCGERRGHPLLFSVALVPRVLSWPDHGRLSLLFGEADLSVVALPGFDDGILRDVDRPGDLRT